MQNRHTRRVFESILSKLPKRLAQEFRIFLFPRAQSLEPYVRVCKPMLFSSADEALVRLAFEKVEATVLVAGIGGLGSTVAEFCLRAGWNVIVVDPKVASIHGQLRGTVTQKESGEEKVYGFAKRVSKSLSNGATVTAYATEVENLIESGQLDFADIELVCACTDNLPSRLTLQEVALEFSKPFVTGGLSDSELPLDGMAFWHGPNMQGSQGCCFGCYQAALTRDQAAQNVDDGQLVVPRPDCSVPVTPSLVALTSAQMTAQLSLILQGKEPEHQLVFTDAVSNSTGYERMQSFRADCPCNPNPGQAGQDPNYGAPPQPDPTVQPSAPQASGFLLH